MLEHNAAVTLVLGVGNLLLSDEGVGVHVIQRLLAEYQIPEEVQVLDGGTLGLDLLYYLEGVENLLIIDAVDMDGEPGELLRLEGDEVPSMLTIKMSPHHIGIPDMLSAARLKGCYPPNVVLWGVQPDSLELGVDLSPVIDARVDVLVGKVLAELDKWGHTAQPKK